MKRYNRVEDFSQALDDLEVIARCPRKPASYIKRNDFDSDSAYYLALAKASDKYAEDLQRYEAARAEYRKAVSDIEAGFKAYCIKALCNKDLPSFIADKLYQQAWSDGHSHGFSKVYSVMEDLAELVNDAYAAGQVQS